MSCYCRKRMDFKRGRPMHLKLWMGDVMDMWKESMEREERKGGEGKCSACKRRVASYLLRQVWRCIVQSPSFVGFIELLERSKPSSPSHILPHGSHIQHNKTVIRTRRKKNTKKNNNRIQNSSQFFPQFKYIIINLRPTQ